MQDAASQPASQSIFWGLTLFFAAFFATFMSPFIAMPFMDVTVFFLDSVDMPFSAAFIAMPFMDVLVFFMGLTVIDAFATALTEDVSNRRVRTRARTAGFMAVWSRVVVWTRQVVSSRLVVWSPLLVWSRGVVWSRRLRLPTFVLP